MENNQTKIREALLAIKEVADRDMGHHVSMSESDQTSIRAWSNLLASLVDSALAEPPRNCDVGTADEQSERFDKFCDEQCMKSCKACPVYKEMTTDIECFAKWAQMPYEADEKGEGK